MHRKTWFKASVAFLSGALFTLASVPASGQAASDLVIRVVDVGAGLCVVIAAPGGHGMLYDAGRSAGRTGGFCRRAVRQMLPGRNLDLVVLSHSDTDHIRELPGILLDNRARVIIHPGDDRGDPSDAATMRQSIARERSGQRADVRDLREIDQAIATPRPGFTPRPVRPGDSFAVGDATATFIAGWSDGREARSPGEPELRDAPMRNGLSIVMRVTYGGHSVLLTGDTVGVMRGNGTQCEYAERVMVDRSASVPIDSDVLIGQHHGAENATSSCFARAVSPGIVVFSAGSLNHHPRQAVVDRLRRIDSRVQILRTDVGDNEGAPEMIDADSSRCPDPPGDDDVEIRLSRTPAVRPVARYVGTSRPCAS
jgi:competence protein ComEC